MTTVSTLSTISQITLKHPGCLASDHERAFLAAPDSRCLLRFVLQGEEATTSNLQHGLAQAVAVIRRSRDSHSRLAGDPGRSGVMDSRRASLRFQVIEAGQAVREIRSLLKLRARELTESL